MESETYEIKVLEKDKRYDRRIVLVRYTAVNDSLQLCTYTGSALTLYGRVWFSVFDRLTGFCCLLYQNITYALKIYVSAGAL